MSDQRAVITIGGAAAGDRLGDSLAAGDVNGDGRPDVLVGADYSGNKDGLSQWGTAYVIFGQATSGDIDLAALGSRGFRINGTSENKGSGDSYSLAAAGDVNGDGLTDVLVGEALADHNGRSASGSAYVVFGGASRADVNLGALGLRGFRIDGAEANDLAGVSVASAGDVNADGYADLAVATRPCCFGGRAGSVYVVFGSSSPLDVDLRALGTHGFRIDGAAVEDFSVGSIAGAGDVNGDRRADVLVSSEYSGPVFVVFGKSDSTRVDLASLGVRGFVIDAGGEAVAGAGDVNRDGLADVVVGDDYASNNAREESGSVYVVFGKTDTATVDLASLGTRGFRIDGAAERDHAGVSVAGAGDVNADGRPDILVGARGSSREGRAGSAYVVFGRAALTRVDLATLGQGGIAIDGAAQGSFTDVAVSGAGDVDQDTHGDLLVGAEYADFNGRRDSGVAYVVYGASSAETVELPGSSDAAPPVVSLNAASPQRVLKQGGVLVAASCNEACTLRGTATISIGGVNAPLAPAGAQLTRAGRRTLKLALGGATRRRIASLPATRRFGSATVTVRASDVDGNVASAKRRIAIR